MSTRRALSKRVVRAYGPTVARNRDWNRRRHRMMSFVQWGCVSLFVAATAAWGQQAPRDPHVGFLYPAGAQQGASIQVVAGGQQINGVTDVYISGDGVHASMKYFLRPGKPLEREQREELNRRIAQRRAVLSGTASAPAAASDTTTLPDLPIMRDLDSLNAKELDFLEAELLRPKPKQVNTQLAERVLLDLTVAADAAPGDRELRFKTPAGLTNPVRFQVGTLPEVFEVEPNDRIASATPNTGPAIELPAVLNGQVGPGDVDRFRFKARKGQRLVLAAHARALMPYLPDAVPGWFQATLTLYDMKSNELAFEDDYRFDPDPVMLFTVPADGEYEVEIRDSIYRGREDFVYRLTVGETPFITSVFPLGGQTGASVLASLEGWNLPTQALPLNTDAGAGAVRHATLRKDAWISNSVSYAVDILPECDEVEPNNILASAQVIAVPQIVNGRIGQPGDVDIYRIDAAAGDEIVAAVVARTLESPMDSLLRLTDTLGKVIAWNDDTPDKGAGLITHQSDSYIRTRLPKNGVYYLQVADTQRHGGPEYAYRLVVSTPRPDFALRVTPSSVNLLTGRAALVTVYALRHDGFDGPIDIRLKDAPAGFRVDGGRIPAGCNHVRMTLTAPMKPIDGPVPLQFEGYAEMGGQAVRRLAVPAEDMMQAFIYRHLVASQDMLAIVTGPKRPGQPIALTGEGPIRIPVDGAATVSIGAQGYPGLADVRLQLSDAPKGISLDEVNVSNATITFALKADGGVAKAGLADNVIVEALTERTLPGKTGAVQKQRTRVGILPAIPIEVVPK